MLLGMQVTRNYEKGTIMLSQMHYIDTMLMRFRLDGANPVQTPLNPNVNLDPEYDEHEDILDDQGSASYATIIGSLMYVGLGSRPDIAYSVQQLAQFMRKPEPKHWTAVKRVLRCLKGTKEQVLTYGGNNQTWNSDLEFYCDADWGSENDRKLISGYVVLCAGGAVAWSSKKQNTVALSTAEAEYIAATHVTKQVLWYIPITIRQIGN